MLACTTEPARSKLENYERHDAIVWEREFAYARKILCAMQKCGVNTQIRALEQRMRPGAPGNACVRE